MNWVEKKKNKKTSIQLKKNSCEDGTWDENRNKKNNDETLLNELNMCKQMTLNQKRSWICKVGLYGRCRRAVNCQIDRCPSLQKTGQLYISKVGRWPDDGCPRSDLQRGFDFAWSDQRNSNFVYLVTWWCIIIDDYYLIIKTFWKLFV